jgi:hypothetical protein
MGWRTFRGGDGDVECDGRSGFGGALDGECSVDLGGALAHSLEAEVALRGEGSVGRIEPLAVVGDGEGQVVRMVAEVEIDVGGLRVALSVGERFLSYAEDFGFDCG